MDPQSWNTSWCPACGGLTVHATASTRPWQDGGTELPASDYMVCPRCETVTVAVPAAAPRWAYRSICAMTEHTWDHDQLALLHGALGQARNMLTQCPMRSQRALTKAAPCLRSVLSEAAEANELEECLIGLSLVLNELLAEHEEPTITDPTELLAQLRDALRPLAQGPATSGDSEDLPA